MVFSLLVTLTLYFFASILVHHAGLTDNPVVLFITLPGQRLYSSLLHASYFVPFFLMVNAVILMRKTFHKQLLFFTSFAVLPVLTAAIILQIQFSPRLSPIALFFTRSFNRMPAVFVLSFLLLVETALIVRLWNSIFIRKKRFSSALNNLKHNLDTRFFNEDENRDQENKRQSFALDFIGPPQNESGHDISENEGQKRLLEYAHPVSFSNKPYSESVEDGPEPLEVQPLHKEDAGLQSFTPVSIDGPDDSEETVNDNDIDIDFRSTKPSDPHFEPPLRPGPVSGANPVSAYDIPAEEVLMEYHDGKYWELDEATRNAAEVLKVTLEEFKITADVTGIRKGPVITMFEILPAPGVKLSKITNLADNIALRLAASRVRIVAPIPGKHAVGIEVPNKDRSIVSFSEMVASSEFKGSDKNIPIILGKDIPGDTQLIDLTSTPHLLIAGATGSGKSVCVNSIICSILFARRPDEVKLLLIDPKIVELKFYNGIPHLLTPVITEPKKALQALQYLLYEMDKRYSMLDAMGVRDLSSYNEKVSGSDIAQEKMPYIVVIVDEFADLMATCGKELESNLARLAAMSRAVGIHLVLATQRPSIDVITGLIKANIPSRIAFMVASKTDSRIILDTMGAEKLLGKGDMLFTSAWNPFPTRIQGAFLSEKEVENVADYVKQFGEPEYIDDEIFVDEDEDGGPSLFSSDGDPLMDKALQIVCQSGKASASYLQRRLKIGYNRAARIVEEMEDKGVVGPPNGSKPREVLHVPDQYQ